MTLADDLERVLDGQYVTELSARSLEELRTMRHECQHVESKVSYLRRMVQGRLDIVSAELERRAQGTPFDLSDLVERLPEILADRVRAPGPGRLPTNINPPDDDDLGAELDAVSGSTSLTSLPDLSDDELRDVSRRLKELEQRLSAQRRSIFAVIDQIQSELAMRYQAGEVGA
jgi:hypothetical protein